MDSESHDILALFKIFKIDILDIIYNILTIFYFIY